MFQHFPGVELVCHARHILSMLVLWEVVYLK
jgi:hypothetical protein